MSIESVMPSNHLVLCHHLLLSPSIFPSIGGSFPTSWHFESSGHGIGASASASVLPMNIQGWFPLGLTGLISWQPKRLSRVFSSTESACSRRPGFDPWVRKFPLRRKWQPIPVFLPGKSHGYTEDSKDTNALPYWRTKEPEIKLPTSAGSSKNQQSFRKTCALLTMPKPLTVWIMTNCGKFFKRWEYQITWPAS